MADYADSPFLDNPGNRLMSATRQVHNLKVDASGHVVLPSETRERLHISGGDTVIIVEDEAGVHLKTRDQLLAEAQASFATLAPKDVLLSKEILQERRSEIYVTLSILLDASALIALLRPNPAKRWSVKLSMVR